MQSTNSKISNLNLYNRQDYLETRKLIAKKLKECAQGDVLYLIKKVKKLNPQHWKEIACYIVYEIGGYEDLNDLFSKFDIEEKANALGIYLGLNKLRATNFQKLKEAA